MFTLKMEEYQHVSVHKDIQKVKKKKNPKNNQNHQRFSYIYCSNFKFPKQVFYEFCFTKITQNFQTKQRLIILFIAIL